MKIAVSSIESISTSEFFATILLGENAVVAQIVEDREGDLPGFNFVDPFFDVLFAHDGLAGRFNRDYWRFRDGRAEVFPWDYGDHSESIVTHALEETATTLTDLFPA